ncbi:hypothetical protein PUW24_00135 (plasmid) [Paenibacillus urinalis]|uniref:Uncharacterized protein n=1 Tax=Paenibacillus urinalis TaxID=521520 RepID=A0AAX3N9G7_9BACL|nr:MULTISPECIES: hypothetical protein [Paenibacillus]MCM3131040.1 hypothetical protein [Paenibacillus sp. MER 78]WDH85372.1 hypothetical protein PUW23_25380 [Paenibacillus urinalis]WDH95190.1 hypothetical protein PUW24_00135 [Paenibacillus urinalis]WDI05336.1 hypothetical protein PUW25_27350 [Paenibacillus urinalis]
MGRDLNILIQESLKELEGTEIDINEQLKKLKSLSDVMIPQMPDSLKSLPETLTQLVDTVHKASKAISTTYDLDQDDTAKVINSIISTSTYSNSLTFPIDFHVKLLKFVKTQIPEKIAIPNENDEESKVEYITREQVQELISDLKPPEGMDLKVFLKYFYFPTVRLIIVLLTIFLNYTEFKENAAVLIQNVHSISQELKTHETPTIKIPFDQDMSGGEKS